MDKMLGGAGGRSSTLVHYPDRFQVQKLCRTQLARFSNAPLLGCRVHKRPHAPVRRWSPHYVSTPIVRVRHQPRKLSVLTSLPVRSRSATSPNHVAPTIDDMLSYSREPIPCALTKLPQELAAKAVKLFQSNNHTCFAS